MRCHANPVIATTPILTWPTGRNQLAEDGYGRHAQNASEPYKADYLVGMADGLPRSRAQRMTDGVVAFARNGHESPGGDGHGGSCGEGSKANNIVAGRLSLSIACIASVMQVPIELT